MSNKNRLNIAEIVGGGYKQYWNFKGRYCVVKGSRGSKKSKTTALWIIYNMMKYKDANTLVVRKTERTLKDSCYADLKWSMNRLGVAHLWKCTQNPLEMTYIPTGQKILYRGFDDALKITSISVEYGCLCWCWVEEAYEIVNEADFDMLNESIRGVVPPGLFKRFMITFNPWSDKHWLKRRFFDTPDTEDKIALTTTYRCNEWLDENDRKLLENLQFTNPRRWDVAANGNWGIVDGLIYENWEEEKFDWKSIARQQGVKSFFGLDFGYTNDETAFVCGLIDTETKDIWIFDEMYQKGMSNERIYEEIVRMGYSKEKIIADSAEPKSIDRLYTLGLSRIKKARKGKDSINNGIDFLQDYKVHIHPRCVNFVKEISNYVWAEDKTGVKLNKPIDDFNHLMDAWRYGVEEYARGSLIGFD